MQGGPIALHLGGLLLIALLLILLDCALLLHASGHAHGSVRADADADADAVTVVVTVAATDARPGIVQMARLGTPAHSSCMSAGSDVEPAVRQEVRMAPVTTAAKDAAGPARAAVPEGGPRSASGEAPHTDSGRSTLCALCRWRT
ncbi:hypothetical protein [Streptomyces sp. NPDC059909]|uniref:hypothetical protein n=1 Tax=Streptomyces sp. NPDC059909 TaxID=3346998 RepID=UPI0036464AC9